MNMFFSFLIVLAIQKNETFVNYIEFEKLLGKSIPEVKIITECNFKVIDRSGIKFYMNEEFFSREFHGMMYNFISITVDQNEKVDSFSINFRQVIDRSFYNSFIEKYGEPDNIQIITNRRVVSETSDSDNPFHKNLTKSEFDLREGSFDEKPLYIIWKKKDFQIKAFLRHKQNMSEITFSVNDK